MIVTHKIKMDLSRRGIAPVVHMVQGDSNTRALEISLYDNGQPWEIPAGASAVANYEKKGGASGLYDLMSDGSNAWSITAPNIVTVYLAPQVLTQKGNVFFTVSLALGDAVISTFHMIIDVEPRAGFEGGAEEPEPDVYQQIIDMYTRSKQVVPLFANSVEECTDTSKVYILPDGMIYAYMFTQRPSYTNLLSSAVPSTDATEVSLLNNSGKGYVADYVRDGGNGKLEANAFGYRATGLIHVKPGDIVRVKGVTVRTQYNTGTIQYFPMSRNPAEKYSATTRWESQWLENGNLVGDVLTFTVPTLELVDELYFTISVGGISDNTIITVNEEISDNAVIKEYAWVSTGHAFVPADYEDRIVALEKFADEIDHTVEEVIAKTANSFDYTAYGLPILYLTGDVTQMSKDNKVTLDYAYGEKTGTCSVKWQGSSSLTYPKKNYTVTFDNAFEAAPGWGAQKKYCMKANFMDFSHSRNLCCAKLWSQIVASRSASNALRSRLVALPNNGAVDGFPIVVVINDKYQGIYTFNIPKDAWMFGMGSGTREAIICADMYGGENYATLFQNTAACAGADFEIEYATDENNTAWVVESVNRLINAVMASNGKDLDTTIAKYVDIDSAIDYLLFAPLVHGADMLKKNYILATYDGVKWFFSAYDMDSTFGITWHAGYYGDADGKSFNPAIGSANEQYPTLGSMATHKLFNLLLENKRETIAARYAELRAGVMSEANVAHEFNEFAAAIPKPYFDEEPKLWPTIPATSANNAGQIAVHYMLRTKLVDADVGKL